MSESNNTDADSINELCETSIMAGVNAPIYLTSIDAFEMAGAICKWLLEETNGSREYAIAKYEDVKVNIMAYLNLQDAKLFALRLNFSRELT